MSLWLTEQGIEHDRIFFDTGWEYKSTYDYLRGELTAKIGKIVELRATITIPESERDSIERAIDGLPLLRREYEARNPMICLILVKGMFPSRMMRFCTQELKWYPLKRHIAALLDAGHDVVNVVGVRAEESEKRAKMALWEFVPDLDCDVHRPMLAHTEAQIIELHTRHNLRPNPLYLARARRVGCWPCINARKDEVRFISEFDPERIELVGELEIAGAKRWGDLREIGRRPNQPTPPTFFAMRPKAKQPLAFVPIAEVVAWSRTAHGSAQTTMFSDEPPDAGCMRWGLCDTGTNANDDES